MNPRVERLALVFGTFQNLLLILTYLINTGRVTAPRGISSTLAQLLEYLSSAIA